MHKKSTKTVEGFINKKSCAKVLKNIIIFLALIGSFILPQAYAEEMLSGSSSFENVPPSIMPETPETFEIKFQYTEGPYALSNFSPVIEVSPDSARFFVHIEYQPLESITQNQIVRMPVTITIDPSINHEKIFLSVFFTGEHFMSNAFYKSGWIDSVTINIRENISGMTLDRTLYSPLKQQQNGTPANEVECKKGLYRGISKSTDKAVCVSGYTLNELIHREWAYPHTSISSNTISGTNGVVNEYCPEGTEFLQGGWYSTKRDVPVELVSSKQIYDPEYDSQGIEMTFNFLENPETYGKSMIFAFVDCDTSFDTFEIIILPNSVEGRKNFVVYYPSGFDNTIHFVNQDDVSYQINGMPDKGVGYGDFTVWIDQHDDWIIDDANGYGGIEYISLTASNPDTGEVYDWMNYRISPKHPALD